MKKTIDVKTVRDGLWMDTNVTYAQVPGWLGNTTRDLKLTVIRHFQNDSDKRYPVIFWFAGGGWMDTDKYADGHKERNCMLIDTKKGQKYCQILKTMYPNDFK